MTPFQTRAHNWAINCFGLDVACDHRERTHRFIEEALELGQAMSMPKEEALQLVDYVYGRPEGEIHQEIGGVCVTLACLCSSVGYDVVKCAEAELERCNLKTMQIREKQKAKPKHSAVPVPEDPTLKMIVENFQKMEDLIRQTKEGFASVNTSNPNFELDVLAMMVNFNLDMKELQEDVK